MLRDYYFSRRKLEIDAICKQPGLLLKYFCHFWFWGVLHTHYICIVAVLFFGSIVPFSLSYQNMTSSLGFKALILVPLGSTPLGSVTFAGIFGTTLASSCYRGDVASSNGHYVRHDRAVGCSESSRRRMWNKRPAIWSRGSPVVGTVYAAISPGIVD